jgi:hypothetical protein
MTVRIHNLISTVHATDTSALMSEPMLDRLAEILAERVMRIQDREQRLADETRLQPPLALHGDEERLA